MSENTFAKLREQLELMEWPNVYFFKFIVPNNSQTVAQTAALFEDTAEMQFHESKTGKFVSVSVKEVMLSVDAIMEVYERAQKIQGIISL